MKLAQSKKSGNGWRSRALEAFIAGLGLVLALCAGLMLRDTHRGVRDLQSEVSALKKSVSELSDCREVAIENIRGIDEGINAAHRLADLAHARIEHYRDVLLIVSKTCPGRMNLPRLGGDPGRKE